VVGQTFENSKVHSFNNTMLWMCTCSLRIWRAQIALPVGGHMVNICACYLHQQPCHWLSLYLRYVEVLLEG